MVGHSAKRNAFEYLYEKYETSKSLICRTLQLHRSRQRRKSTKDDSQVELKLQELAAKDPTRCRDWYYLKIPQEGLKWNRKRIIRVYRKLNLAMRRKSQKRIQRPHTQGLTLPLYQNIMWSMDFMSDSLDSGRKVRILNIIDDFNRECLSIEVGLRICSSRVTRVVLDWLIELRGKPQSNRTDNGSEFTSHHYKDWCEQHGVQANYI